MTTSIGPDRDAREGRRLRTLRSFDILDTPPHSDFDDLTGLAADLCQAPIALITLLDADRQWFKSRRGFDPCETSLDESFCVHALDGPELLVIPDAHLDPRVSHYRCVREAPYFRFYAGAPLVASDGEIIGTLCVADSEPRELSTVQLAHLTVLAAQVMAQLEIRRQAIELAGVVREMTDTKRMLDGLLAHTDVLIYAKDVDGKYVMVNPAVQEATRITGDMIGHTDHDLFEPDRADEYRHNDERIMSTGQRQVFTERIVHDDGSCRTYRSTKFPIYDDAGGVIGTAGVSTDVTELEAERAAHQAAEQRLRTLVEQSPVAITVIGQDGTLLYANPATAGLCGAPGAAALQGRCALDLFVPDQRDGVAELMGSVLRGEPPTKAGRARLRRDDDLDVEVEFTLSLISYSDQPAIQAEVRDITADLSDRQELENFANTDALTGIMNRRSWTARVASMAIAEPVDGTSPRLTVAMLDVDHFKAFNDRYGHPAGDDLLQRIAHRLQADIRQSDVLCRWGGEEFAIALPDLDTAHAADVLDRLRQVIPSGQTCSIGYASWEADDDLHSCMARADEALYAAKRGGRNRVVRHCSPLRRSQEPRGATE